MKLKLPQDQVQEVKFQEEKILRVLEKQDSRWLLAGSGTAIMENMICSIHELGGLV